MTLQERLDSWSVDASNGCREWARHRNPDGYGMLWLDGVAQRTHRAAWIDVHGAIPDGMHVLHRCDNRRCINIDHLFLGSNADNVADKVSKGRQFRPNAKGSQNNNAKLDEEKVAVIRRLIRSGASNGQVARNFGVSIMTISMIRNHRTWTHVKECAE